MNRSFVSVVVLLAAVFVPSAFAQSNFIYVANAGEDTVSKIDVTANVEVARYATWFTNPDPNYAPHLGNAWGGPAPSRIARDSAGNAYVLNRMFDYVYGPPTGPNTPPTNKAPHLPVLLKIAASASGTTSAGSTVLPIRDTTTSNPVNIDPGEAADTAILWAKPVGTAGSDETKTGRAVCMDTTGVLWVGIRYAQKYYRVDSATGAMLPPLTGIPTGAHQPYGCEVDVNGKLWSVDSQKNLVEIDTKAATYPVKHHDHGYPTDYGTNYSLSVFNDCSTSPPTVKVYLSESYGKKTFIAYDPQTSTFSNPPLAGVDLLNSVAVGVDSHGNIISGDYNTGYVVKTAPSGSVLWNTHTVGSTQPTGQIHGLIIDMYDDVWVVDRTKGQVIKYSGANGSFIKTVKVGDQPYTYGNTPPATCTGNTGGGSPDTGGCAPVKGDVRCLPNGGYSYTFTVTNNSGHAMSQLLLTPVQGAAFTLAPQLTTFSTPLQTGQSTTLTTIISGAKLGDKVCFFVSLLSEKDPCCNEQVCLTMPQCGGVSPTPPPPPARTVRPSQLHPGRRRP